MSDNRWLVAATGVAVFLAILGWRVFLSGSGPDPEPVMPAVQTGAPVPVAGSDKAAGPPRQGLAAAAEDTGSEEPVTIKDQATMQALFMSLAGRLEGPMRAWAETRGMPREDPSGNYMLEQPYQQYDDETLQALARNGDMWAQQILAGRIAELRPAEAMEYYRQAAASGSVYAMLMLAELSGRIAAMSPDFRFEDEGVALEQYYSLRDAPLAPDVTAYAWNAVAEMAGLPGYMAMLGGARLSPDKLEAGCQLASSIYSDLLEQRAAKGLGGYPSDPPPVWVDADMLADKASACEHERAISYDFSACTAYIVQQPESAEELNFYVCHDS